MNSKDSPLSSLPPQKGSKLEDWLTWLFHQHPQKIELGLERVGAVWESLDSSRLNCPVITVAGTNGKGSCVAIMDAILRAAGYRTGCYTSPHLLRFNERIRIAGEPAKDRRICEAFEKIEQIRKGTRLTYFEFATLAALDIFATATPDLVILEVGLGGRLDAVNILDPDVALVTTVDMDHMAWLGDDRERIGWEKAGIFRVRRPAVCGDGDPPQSLLERASELAAPLFVSGRDFNFSRDETGWDWRGPDSDRIALPRPALQGDYQFQNAAAAVMTLECLPASLPVSEAAIRRGLQSVSLAGRFQVIPGDVTIILDVAHNAQGVHALATTLDSYPAAGCTRAVFGMMADKDVTLMTKMMGRRIDAWHLADLPVDRGMSAEDIASVLQESGMTGPAACHDNVGLAFRAARDECSSGDRILVFGSFLTVAEALPLVQSLP